MFPRASQEHKNKTKRSSYFESFSLVPDGPGQAGKQAGKGMGRGWLGSRTVALSTATHIRGIVYLHLSRRGAKHLVFYRMPKRTLGLGRKGSKSVDT